MPREAPPGQESSGFSLNGERVAIGSAPGNDLRIADSSVSRQHALLERTADGYRLSDRGSTNGTYVNGRRITVTVAVRAGDELRFGARGYRLLRDAQPPVATRRRSRAAAAIAAAALLLALAAFALTQRALRSARKLADGGITPPSASFRNPALVGDALASPTNATDSSTPPTGAAARAATIATPAQPPPPAVTAADLAAAQPWLEPLNHYRMLAGLAAIAPDPALDLGDTTHARYLVKTYPDQIKTGIVGPEAHIEDRSSSWYSPAGLIAAKASDVEIGYQPDSEWITPAIATRRMDQHSIPPPFNT